ncbi:hypothetical protein JTE90_017392 [Oedothorax gibbosus]|uniref:TIL domain-containing protein n=1 Tax=Oedothorax gibbosus TaxID=931172 RepID=A0AAV6TVI8_9ARAC|nr:hypothetical protein JTE90_017392 [Oedothorax gibbosus]
MKITLITLCLCAASLLSGIQCQDAIRACLGNTTYGQISGCDLTCKQPKPHGCPRWITQGCACKPDYIAVRSSLFPECVLPQDCPKS